MQSLLSYLETIIEGAVRRGDSRSASIYRTFKAEIIHKYGKEPSYDNAAEYAHGVLSKMEETKELASKNGATYTPPEDEVQFLADFVPPQLSQQELTDYFLTKIQKGESNKGKLMKSIKSDHAFAYNGKRAAIILGSLLSNSEAK